MEITALFIFDSKLDCDLSLLQRFCRENELGIVDYSDVQDHERLRGLLPKTANLVFLPVKEDDCFSVKMIQEAVSVSPCNLVLLYGEKLPCTEFVSLAYREGASDIIALGSGADAVTNQARRALKLLSRRVEEHNAQIRAEQIIESLKNKCRELEISRARLEERFLALASTGQRLASGRLNIAQDAPVALILSASTSQTNTAAEIARKLGFDPKPAFNAKEALECLNDITPRVILTSNTLPDMDARDFAKQARQKLRDKPVVIIVWSSSADTEYELLEPGTGIDDFVLKTAGTEAGDLLAASLLGSLR